MAKESYVTRTITTTLASILCLDVDSGEACNRNVVLPRTYKKDSDIIKAAVKVLADEPNVHPVHVVDCEVCETLYGMPESKFIANAEKITRNKKGENE